MRIHEFIQENILSKVISKIAAPTVGQTFNFVAVKPDIVNRIAQALKTGQPVDLKDPVYAILRNSNAAGAKMVDQLGYTVAQKAAYKTALDNWPSNNGAWAQKNFGPAKTTTSQPGARTYNYYSTITKDRANLDKFMKSFPDLDRRMQQLSQQTGQPISYKTNANLTALAADNDNLKFFYYDPKLKPQIEATVVQWLQASGISTGLRSHTSGVDVKGVGSYGEIITNHVNDALNNTIRQHGAKYTPEQYYTWLGTNFKTLIAQVTVK
jgi:hypothetical protein